MTRKIVALPGVTVFKPDDASGKGKNYNIQQII